LRINSKKYGILNFEKLRRHHPFFLFKGSIKGGVNKRDIKNKFQLVCIHTARRTLATQLYEHGLPLVQIMKITGHKKLATLQKYIKSDSDIEMMLDIGNSIGKN
jgi:integrase